MIKIIISSGDLYRIMIKIIISSGDLHLNVASKPWVIILCILGVLYTEEVEIQFVSTKFCRHICLKALLTAVLVSYPEIARCVAVMYNIGLNFFVYEYLNVNVQCNLKIPHKSKWF